MPISHFILVANNPNISNIVIVSRFFIFLSAFVTD